MKMMSNYPMNNIMQSMVDAVLNRLESLTLHHFSLLIILCIIPFINLCDINRVNLRIHSHFNVMMTINLKLPFFNFIDLTLQRLCQ